MSENASKWRMRSVALAGRLSANEPKSRVRTPMRHVLAFSLILPPRSDPGRFGYLRCMLCALGQVVTPLDGLGAGARSRRNLKVRDSL